MNWQTFRTRTLTSLIFVVVMLAGLLVNRWTFLILFLLVHFGCWLEFVSLVRKIDQRRFLYSSLGGLVYITIPLFLLIALRWSWHFEIRNEQEDFTGKMMTLCLVFSLWINDTMAYLVGSLVGRTQMSKISPKKTWEGTIGGALLCIIAMYFAASLLSIEPLVSGVIALVSSVVGTLGDLFESRLKRMAGVKDSGHILPGHGGFLDRFDSLLFAAPLVSLYVYFFLR